MNKVIDFPQLNFFQNFGVSPLKSLSHSSCFRPRYRFAYEKRKSNAILSSSLVTKVVDQAEDSILEEYAVCDGGHIAAFPHVQSLRYFPKEELFGKVVMVRFDTMILLEGMKGHKPLPKSSFSTIKYLHESGAKVTLVGSWNENTNYGTHTKSCLSAESVAEFLSSMLELDVVLVKHVFGYMHLDAEHSKTVDILLLDNLFHCKEIGGANLADKAVAVQFLGSMCDCLVFVGNMAFQIMHALGVPVPVKLVEPGALKEAVRTVEFLKSRNIPLTSPQDVWCIKDHTPSRVEIVSVHSIREGWQPADIGPRSLDEMTSLLLKCKKIMLIGPLRFSSSKQDKGGTFKLAETLGTLNSCEVTFVGKIECEELLARSKSSSKDNFLKSVAVVWEVLKGAKLPGLMAPDRAYPCPIDWSVSYDDPTRPLVVDVGSAGGSLFRRCSSAWYSQCALYYNATSTFRSILSTYPGKVVLVSIQCPNPDFNKTQYRWRMLQRSLVEAIVDISFLVGRH